MSTKKTPSKNRRSTKERAHASDIENNEMATTYQKKKRFLGPDDSTPSDTGSEEDNMVNVQHKRVKLNKSEDSTASEDPDPEDEEYLIFRMKHSAFKAITEKAIAENPGLKKALSNYFEDIALYTQTETSWGRLLNCDNELYAIKGELTAALSKVDGLIRGEREQN